MFRASCLDLLLMIRFFFLFCLFYLLLIQLSLKCGFNTINKTDSSVAIDHIYIIEHNFSFQPSALYREKGMESTKLGLYAANLVLLICTYLTNFLTAEILYKIVYYMIFKERLCNAAGTFSDISKLRLLSCESTGVTAKALACTL